MTKGPMFSLNRSLNRANKKKTTKKTFLYNCDNIKLYDKEEIGNICSDIYKTLSII